MTSLDSAGGESFDADGSGPVFLRTSGGQGDHTLPTSPRMVAGARLVLEDGTDLGVLDSQGTLPRDLPAGYHHLHPDRPGGDGRPRLLVASPGVCHRPPDLRAWGWAVQLYGARSTESWGMGDLVDAERLGVAMARASAGPGAASPLLLLNPLHAVNPSPEPTASPYYASSRCFRNPLYLRVEAVPGADRPDVAALIAELAAAGRALNDDPRVDRARVWALKGRALAAIWDALATGPSVDVTRVAVAAALTDPVLAAFAAYAVACEEHGGQWRHWPVALRHRDGAGWSGLRAKHQHRIDFHAWLQLLVAEQLDALHATVPVLHDLAIGTDPHGFDAWYWRDLFVLDGTSVGAPPDAFNTQGQDWGLPPLDPVKLRAADYEPFIRMLRANLSHGSGLRMDHVMGLFRLFWVPPDASPRAGSYVRQPASDLLDLLALESVRAGAIVVGEDLGTVEPGVREALAARGVLAYKVMELEEDPPSTFPANSLASFATHDLPTVPGLWSGADLAAQERLRLQPNVEGTVAARERVRQWAGMAADSPVHDVVAGVYSALAQAPSQIVLGSLEDALEVQERPNMPGTTDEWPNWCQTLPLPLDEVTASPLVQEIAATLANRADGSAVQAAQTPGRVAPT